MVTYMRLNVITTAELNFTMMTITIISTTINTYLLANMQSEADIAFSLSVCLSACPHKK